MGVKAEKPPYPKEIHGWTVGEKLGEGGFGAVFAGTHSKTGQTAAIKLIHGKSAPTLSKEAKLYEKLDGCEGFPLVHYHGFHKDWAVLILDLLAADMHQLLQFCGGTFSLLTTVRLADQMLQRLEAIHSHGIIHNDIKPLNFMMDADSSTVHLIDLGVSTVIRASEDGVYEQKANVLDEKAVGTRAFWSSRLHIGQLRSFRDDLEALCYCLILFVKGDLPWQGIPQAKKVTEIKIRTPIEIICEGLPLEFLGLLRTCRAMAFGVVPDYPALRKSFRSLYSRLLHEHPRAERRMVHDWDWIKLERKNDASFEGRLSFRHAQDSASVLLALDLNEVRAQEAAKHWVLRTNLDNPLLLGFLSVQAAVARHVLISLALGSNKKQNRACAKVRFRKHDTIFEIVSPPYKTQKWQKDDSYSAAFGDGNLRYVLKAKTFGEVKQWLLALSAAGCKVERIRKAGSLTKFDVFQLIQPEELEGVLSEMSDAHEPRATATAKPASLSSKKSHARRLLDRERRNSASNANSSSGDSSIRTTPGYTSAFFSENSSNHSLNEHIDLESSGNSGTHPKVQCDVRRYSAGMMSASPKQWSMDGECDADKRRASAAPCADAEHGVPRRRSNSVGMLPTDMLQGLSALSDGGIGHDERQKKPYKKDQERRQHVQASEAPNPTDLLKAKLRQRLQRRSVPDAQYGAVPEPPPVNIVDSVHESVAVEVEKDGPSSSSSSIETNSTADLAEPEQGLDVELTPRKARVHKNSTAHKGRSCEVLELPDDVTPPRRRKLPRSGSADESADMTPHRRKSHSSSRHSESADGSADGTPHRRKSRSSSRHLESADASSHHLESADGTPHRRKSRSSSRHLESADASSRHLESADASSRHLESADASVSPSTELIPRRRKSRHSESADASADLAPPRRKSRPSRHSKSADASGEATPPRRKSQSSRLTESVDATADPTLAHQESPSSKRWEMVDALANTTEPARLQPQSEQPSLARASPVKDAVSHPKECAPLLEPKPKDSKKKSKDLGNFEVDLNSFFKPKDRDDRKRNEAKLLKAFLRKNR